MWSDWLFPNNEFSHTCDSQWEMIHGSIICVKFVRFNFNWDLFRMNSESLFKWWPFRTYRNLLNAVDEIQSEVPHIGLIYCMFLRQPVKYWFFVKSEWNLSMEIPSLLPKEKQGCNNRWLDFETVSFSTLLYLKWCFTGNNHTGSQPVHSLLKRSLP